MITFWPTYVSLSAAANSLYTHFHAMVATLWVLLIALIWLERNARGGRGVFPAMLVVFVAAQVPALFSLTGQDWWQSFARWFAGLPLT